MRVLIFHLGAFLAIHLPLCLSFFIARFIAQFYYLFGRRLRSVIKENYRQVLIYLKEKEGKDFDIKELDRLCKESFINFSRYLVEVFRIPKYSHNYFRKHLVLEGNENLEEAFTLKKGVISLTAHLGNWELAGVAAKYLGYPLGAVALFHSDRRINNMFLRRREERGIEIIPSGKMTKKILTLLKNNGIVALLGDRLIRGESGVKVKFFGRETLLPQGPVLFSLKTGAPIIPGFLVRERDKYLLVFDKPIYPEVSGDREKDIANLAKKSVSVLEKYISHSLSQWLIFHPVWRNEL